MKKKIMAMFAKLGFTEKVKAGTMTEEDWLQFSTSFKTEHQVDILQAIKQAQNSTTLEKEHQEILAAFFNDETPAAPAEGETPATPVEGAAPAARVEAVSADPVVNAILASVSDMKKTIQTQAEKITSLEKEPENVPAVVVGKKIEGKKILLAGPGTNATHLFGIADPLFALKNRWNINASKMHKFGEDYTPEQKEDFHKEFNAYGRSLGARLDKLQLEGRLGALVQGTIDYTDLESEFGAYYRVRRQDAILTHIITLPSIGKVLPVRYGVQDEETITNHFAGASFSQSYQAGHVFAGNHGFQGAKAKISDVMFKYKFSDLKKLEREHIGYLNREGSDPMKWNFIEWLMVRTSEILHNEKEIRRVRGVRVEPTATKSAFFMYASNGILTTMDALAYAVKPSVYAMDGYKSYTRATIVDYIFEFVRNVYRMRGTLNGLSLCMNDLDVYDYLEGTRTKYGKDTDFQGEKLEIKNFIFESIVRIPNMGMGRKDVWMMPKEALEVQEGKAGEAYAFYFQRDLEELIAASWFKEGTFAFAGKQFDSKALMLASKGKQSQIFKNHPVTELAADATTCDAYENEMFQTIANAAATAITDITNAGQGIAYRIFCGSLTNATTVAKANKFADLTAAYTPTAVGDYLRVIHNPTTDTFIELERKVGGVITVNANAKAPEYVEA